MKINFKPKILLAFITLLGLSLSSCLWMMAPMMSTHTGETEAKEESDWTFWKKLETVETPQQHRSIAKSYRQNAEDYRLLAKKHQRFKATYQGYKDKPGADEATAEFMAIHCQRLVEKFTELADEMEILAQKHEVMAEKAAGYQKEGAE